MEPAPPVSFNLTFVCPEGQVFEQDWFATPFIMMTCQVTAQPQTEMCNCNHSSPAVSLMSPHGTTCCVCGVSIFDIYC